MEEKFIPLIKRFCEATLGVGIEDSFPTLFLPQVMENYWSAEQKIFYIGRDTNGWNHTSELMRSHCNGNYKSYFESNQKWMRNFGFLDYNANKSSGFWTIAMRLHLRLKGLTENLTIGNKLPKEYFQHISDFGWGNTNSIQVPKSFGDNEWGKLDKEKYWAIKKHSQPIDKLNHIIESFNPNLIFIFNWECNERKYLEGLEYVEQKHDLIKNHFWTYYLPNTNTRIIWTIHPTGARWQGYSTNGVVDEILDFLKK